MDLTNGLFELVSGFLICINIRQLYIDKRVHGVSLIPTTFFWTWGIWNLFYYSDLHQWFSFIGGIILLTTNTIWFSMALYYRKNR